MNRRSDLFSDAKSNDTVGKRDCDPISGSDDGKRIFESIFATLEKKTVAQAA